MLVIYDGTILRTLKKKFKIHTYEMKYIRTTIRKQPLSFNCTTLKMYYAYLNRIVNQRYYNCQKVLEVHEANIKYINQVHTNITYYYSRIMAYNYTNEHIYEKYV